MALAPNPADLAKRLAAARSRISVTAKADLAMATTPAHKPPPPPPPVNTTRKNAAQKTAKATAPEPTPAAAPKGKKGRAADGRAVGAAPPSEIAAALRAAAGNATMARLVSDEQLVGVWQAIVDGAARLGPAGAADRAALGRAIGLPIHQYAGGSGRGPGGKNAGPEIAGRLETALNRSRSRAPVTDDEPEAEIPMETAA